MSKVILFDGYCNLCNNSINFIKKHDTNTLYEFVSLQSKDGQVYLKKYKLPTDNFDTLVFIEKGQVFTASTAVLMIFKNFSGKLRHLYILKFIPRFLRDFIYKLIAKNRYTLFGKSKQCTIHIQG